MDEMKQQSAKITRGLNRNNSVITVLKSHETVINAGDLAKRKFGEYSLLARNMTTEPHTKTEIQLKYKF